LPLDPQVVVPGADNRLPGQLLHCRVGFVSTEEFHEAFLVEELVVRKVEACAPMNARVTNLDRREIR
jgi:hypothetical protein